MHQASKISLDQELSMAFVGAYAEVFGQTPQKYEFWDFSTNGVALVRLGVPLIGFGPSEIKLAHMRDEKCAVQEIVDACAVYAAVIGKL